VCTVLVASHVVPGLPLVVVANRDEQLDRASRGPTLDAGSAVLAPRDLVAGGTWLGLNRDGLFVAITNRSLVPVDPRRTSRGRLVADALARVSARLVHEDLAELPAARHNGFHLLYVDLHGPDRGLVRATVGDGSTRARLVLGHGLSAITERSFGAGDDRGRRARLGEAWRVAKARLPARASLADLEAFTRVLADHDEAAPFDATCIHAEGVRYGTRSAMVLGADDAGAVRMLWAEGPPCRTSFEEVPAATFADCRSGPKPATDRACVP
jgi:uncharacterized protein with NRDE domain